MRYRISELSGALLDAAVAQCEGAALPDFWRDPDDGTCWARPGRERWAPTESWEQAGPIIERERIDIDPPQDHEVGALDGWSAICLSAPDDGHRAWKCGPTPLIAAMRAYVASKHGEKIELP